MYPAPSVTRILIGAAHCKIRSRARMEKSDGTAVLQEANEASAAARPHKRRMTRWHAAGAHLLISALVAAAMLALMLALWYPPPLFQAMGGAGLALIVIGVDVV